MPNASAAAPPSDVAAWLRLTRTEGLERGQMLSLLKRFGLPEALLQQPLRDLAEVVGRDLALRLRSEPEAEHQAILAATILWLAHPGRDTISLADPRYPPQLLHEDAAAALLFIDGDEAALKRPRLALIAPQLATRAAIACGVAFAHALVDARVALLLHFGNDFAAAIIEQVLPRSGADVVAVQYGGLDRVAPARHLEHARALVARGALVSEAAPGETQPPNAHSPHLLISALPVAMLVFEAGVNSAEVRMARQAGQLGRDLFAIPGSIHAPLARGCHQLIRDGARLVESISDVLEEASEKFR